MPVLEGIVRMGHALGMEVVIEGVESEAQVEALLVAGAQAMQGYLLGRPARPVEGRLPSTVRRAGALVD